MLLLNQARLRDVAAIIGFHWHRISMMGAVGLLLHVLLMTCDATASMIVAATESDLLMKSNAVMYGTVVNTGYVTTPSGWTFTHAEVYVEDGLLGAQTGETIFIEVPGGLMPNGSRLVISGAPQLVPGQRIVGFLERRADQADVAGTSAPRQVSPSSYGVFRPLGLANGILTVQSDAQGVLVAHRDLSGVMMLDPQDNGQARQISDQAQQDEPLDGLLQRLRDQIQQQEKSDAGQQNMLKPDPQTDRSTVSPTQTQTQVSASTANCVDVGNNPDTIACDGVTALLRGYRWVLPPNTSVRPATMEAVEIRLQSDGPGQSNLPTEVALQAVMAQSVAPWTASVCDGSTRPNLRFVEGARYANHDTGDNSQIGYNNIVYWENNPSTWIGDSLTLAITPSQYLPSTGYLATSDLIYNDINFHWRVDDGNGGIQGCDPSNDTNCFDLVTVGLHEMGHFLGLGHTQCVGSVMLPSGSSTTVRHALTVNETAGVCAIYPPRPSSAVNRANGELCRLTSQCPSGSTCLWPDGITPQNSANTDYGICVTTCTVDTDCNARYRCQRSEDGETYFCTPGLRPANGTFWGYESLACVTEGSGTGGTDPGTGGTIGGTSGNSNSSSSTSGCGCGLAQRTAPSATHLALMMGLLLGLCRARVKVAWRSLTQGRRMGVRHRSTVEVPARVQE